MPLGDLWPSGAVNAGIQDKKTAIWRAADTVDWVLEGKSHLDTRVLRRATFAYQP